MPALIDQVVRGKVEPDYAHLLRLLWNFQDYPQLTRLIKYVKAEASEYDKQTLVDFLEDYEPDDLLDRIQPWWKDRAPAPRADDGSPAQAQEPDTEARQAWTAFTTAYAQWRADVKKLLEHDSAFLVEAAREQLGEDVEKRILPVLLEEVGIDVTMTAQGSIQDALAAAGFAQAAQRIREVERERIGAGPPDGGRPPAPSTCSQSFSSARSRSPGRCRSADRRWRRRKPSCSSAAGRPGPTGTRASCRRPRGPRCRPCGR